MKLKRPNITSGFRPYIMLALVLLILYFAISPFIKLTDSSDNGNPSSYSGQQFGGGDGRNTSSGDQSLSWSFRGKRKLSTFVRRTTAAGNFSGKTQATSSGVQPPSGNFGGKTQATSSGTSTSSGTDKNNSFGDRNASFFHNIQSDFSSAAIAVEGDLTARVMMIVVICLIILLISAFYYKRLLTPKIAGIAIFATGVTMRFGYMLYTPYSVRGHDVGNINGNGHIAYIYNLYKNFSLPSTNSGQFYHPPLSYIIDAIVAHFYALVTQCTNTQTILEATRLVPCFASCALLIVCYKLFEELKFDNTAKLTALGIIALQPTFFILSASINNDMLMIFFFMTAFLYTVRWYNNPNYKNIILLAVSSGCAMMTKISGGLIVAFSGIVFLIILVKGIKSKTFVRLIGQFAAYVVIFLPLGLWYAIRNLILFKQPIGYVLQLGQNSNMYTGGKSFFERFISFPIGSLLKPLYCNTSGDFNLLMYTVKCSIFGEFTFTSSHDVMAAILIILNLIMILFSLAAMIYVMIRRRETSVMTRWGFFGIWILLLISFIYFNIKYPLTCTMDFRYIVPTIITGAAFLGLANSQMRKSQGRLPRCLYYLCSTVTVAFALSSIIFYVL